jgi:hypothetical protein
MSVWYLVYVTDSLTYTVAKALLQGGHEVSVCAVGTGRLNRPPDAIQRRLMVTEGIRFFEIDDPLLPREIDRLIVQVFPRPHESIVDVWRLASRARRITLITAGDRSRSWREAVKLQWQEAKRLARYASRIDRVLYKDGWHARDLLGMLKPRDVVGFDVHSQFLHDADLHAAMHARDWDPHVRRPYRVNFLGSQDPAPRKKILDSVRSLFTADAASTAATAGPRPMFWHEYSDADPVGVPPREFIRLLTESDFTLCPRGYSLVTHRPIEALLRGSIPVLARDEIGLYGANLVDGENCIGVAEGAWAKTVHRLSQTDERDILRMRMNAAAMFDDYLAYDALARRLRTRVGVPDDLG